MYLFLGSVNKAEDNAIISGSIEPLDGLNNLFNQGVAISEEILNIDLDLLISIHSIRGRMADYLWVEGIDGLVFSEKAKDLLQQMVPDNIQLFPLVIIDKFSNLEEVQMAGFRDEKLDYKTITYNNYFIGNVIGLVDCVDHDASDLEYYVPKQEIPENMPEDMKAALQQEVDNDIDFIRKLVLDEEKIPQDIKIFRLKDCPRILVFKEEIVNAIKEAKLTGFVFVPLEKYTDEIPDDDNEEETDKVVEQVAKTPAKAAPEPPRTGSGIIIKGIKNN